MNINKQIFLENLPRHRGKNIDWEKSVGNAIDFIYDNIEGKIEIVDYNRNKQRYLTIRYKEYHTFDIYSGSFLECAIGTYLNNIVISAPWMIQFFPNGYSEAIRYTKTCGQKIYPICPDCGKIKNKLTVISDIYSKRSIRCTCGDGISYPEKFIFNLLEQLGIVFYTEYSPDWIKPKRYDFYFELNKKKYILEMDGLLGHGNQSHYKDTRTVEETLEIDNYKDKLAKEHGIEVIRIDSRESVLEYLKNNIMLSKLNDLFDLSGIDWYKLESFALSNLVKKACKFKKDDINLTTKDIGDMMNLSDSTICRYLKRGAKIGWCDYSVQTESFKGSSKSGKLNGKPVEIFKDNISLGIFNSTIEIERQSEKLFGVKLTHGHISSVCNGKRNHHKGFLFHYV